MKRLTVVIVALVVTFGAWRAYGQSLSIQYHSGMFLAIGFDDIKATIDNPDTTPHNFRVIIRQVLANTTPTVVYDSGTVSIAAGQGTHADYQLPSDAPGNDYAVEIDADSHRIVPSVYVFPGAGGGVLRSWVTPSGFAKF